MKTSGKLAHMRSVPRHLGMRLGRAAFTLIELIVVIVITAILAGVAVPAMNSIANSRGSGAARAIVQHLSFAREQALNSGNRVWVVFDPDAESYALFAEPDGGSGYADALSLVDPTTGRQMGMRLDRGEFAGIGIASASFVGSTPNLTPVVGFDWLGSPLTQSGSALGSDGEVVLTTGTMIEVRVFTGDIRIAE